MFLIPSNCTVSSTDKELAVPKKKLTRREKKGKQHYCSRNRSLKKFEVSQENKQVKYKHNGKKNAKRLKKYNLDYRIFYKVEAIFNKWIAANIHRFNVKPIRQSNGSYQYYNYYFEGVVKNVALNISTRRVEASLAFTYYGKDNQCFDQIDLEYIMNESFHPKKGFYDADNVTDDFNYFPTRKELYINQVFEVALQSCNEMLVPENSLYLLDFREWTAAYIDTTDESNITNKQVKHYLNKLEIVDLSSEKCLNLLKQCKVYRIIKYDLYKLDKKPLLKYYWRK